jgi:O-antigen/teichoic acid export membrane protein
MPNLKNQALKGGAWTVGAQIAHFVLQIASLSVLARLLTPEDFGLIGMLAAVIAVLGLFREMGLSTAIVQRSSIVYGELSRLFWLSVYLGISLGILTALAGFGAAWLMDEPRLIPIAPWFGACFLLGSLETVPGGLLRRHLKFRSIAVRDVSVRLIGFIAAVVAAIAGLGYWALVIQSVISAILQLILTWNAAEWWPKERASSWGAIRPYIGFGAAFTGSNLASYFTQNLDSLLIGKMLGAGPLGFYSRARMLMIQPVNQFMGPIGTVLLPILCKIKDDIPKTRKTIALLAIPFLTLPSIMAAWLMAGAPEVVRIFLGPDWGATTEILRWLACSIIYLPFGSLLYLVLVSSGRTNLLIHWTWTGALTAIAGYIIGVKFGVVWVAVAFSLTGIAFRVPIALYFCNKTGLINLQRLAASYIVALVIAGCLFGTLYYARIQLLAWTSNDCLVLLGLAVPCAVFLAIALALHPVAKTSLRMLLRPGEM